MTDTDNDRPLEWKTLDTEYINKTEWFTARVDRCVKPDGQEVYPYYVLEYPEWVNALAFTKDNKVILIRQFRQAYGDVTWELPGGCVDDEDATPEEAIARELLEETGYRFDKIERVAHISPNASTQTNISYSFIATGGERVAEQALDDNEDIIVKVISLDELKQLVFQNKLMQTLHITTIFYAFRQLKISLFE